MNAMKNFALPDLKHLDKHDIKAGLAAISKYIKTDPGYTGQAVPIVVVGGVCSILVLRNRKTTKDIDYFVGNGNHISLIGESSRQANKSETKRFPRAWMSADAMSIAGYPGNERAFADSVAQNEVLFTSDSLVVYAADWHFQLVNKMSRVHQLYGASGPADNDVAEAEKDLDDTLAILNRLVTNNNGQPIRKADVQTWYFYGRAMGDRAFDIVNGAYQAKYNVRPIV